MAHNRKTAISTFMELFVLINIFILLVGYNSIKIWDCPDILECTKILSLKSFGHSRGNLYALCSSLRSTLCCTCYDRKICSNIKWSQNIMTIIVCKIFFCFLCLLLTAPIAESSHILPWISFTFLLKFPKQQLKGFQYQICTSVKKSEM